MTSESATSAKRDFLDLREQMARVLGLQTVDMLIDRSATEIRAAHPMVRNFTVIAGELSLESVDLAFENVSREEAAVAVKAMTGVMLVVLARLLGRRIAHSLAEQIDKADLLESVRL